MKQYGLVSIVMPCYNGEKYILRTIRSVQKQTYQNWELLIVDDCSTDRSEQVIKSVDDPRIHVLTNTENSGAAVSRNYALRMAKGKWVAFLDSDDLWEPQKLEKQLRFMIEKDYKFTFTDYRIIFPDGKNSPYIYTGPARVTKNKMWRYCYFSTITVMYDREYVGLIQIADVKKNNDYAMWLKIIEKTDCYRYPHCLSVYCKRDNSISSGSKWKLIKHHYILFRKACNISPPLAVLCTLRNLIWGVHKKLFYRKKV
ncbi:glycosyltransferase family 2 protein [Lachnospiraceae bacterium]|nr:glycosyltransferase family 2 protein [Lachnospiraceae bacterium]